MRGNFVGFTGTSLQYTTPVLLRTRRFKRVSEGGSDTPRISRSQVDAPINTDLTGEVIVVVF